MGLPNENGLYSWNIDYTPEYDPESYVNFLTISGYLILAEELQNSIVVYNEIVNCWKLPIPEDTTIEVLLGFFSNTSITDPFSHRGLLPGYIQFEVTSETTLDQIKQIVESKFIEIEKSDIDKEYVFCVAVRYLESGVEYHTFEGSRFVDGIPRDFDIMRIQIPKNQFTTTPKYLDKAGLKLFYKLLEKKFKLKDE